MSLRKLVESLELLNELNEKLLQLAEQKKEALIKGNFDELLRTTTGESSLIKSIRNQEEVQQEMAHEFMREKGIKSRLSLTISEISRLVFDPEEKASLLDVQKKLVENLGKLKRLNELNQTLVAQSLSFIDFSLNLYIEEDDSTYSRPDQINTARTAKRNGVFDTRA
ncbi:FlgN protein [compost metagenome]